MKDRILAVFLILFSIAASAYVLKEGRANYRKDEGVLHSRVYMVDNRDTFNFSKSFRLVDSGTYLIKGNKIRRKAYDIREQDVLSSGGSAGGTVNVTVEIIKRDYLIDFDSKLLFSFLRDSPIIKERPISALNFDFLYGPRAQKFNKLRVLNIDTLLIGNFEGNPVCQGTALMLETNDTAVFLYTPGPLPLKSPLNNWLPDCKYNVLSLAMRLRGKTATGKLSWFVMEVYGMKRRNIDPGLFKVDSSRISRN